MVILSFLFLLFNTLDRGVITNPIIFSKVIEEINFLQTQGINVDINGKKIKVFFVLSLIIGDNLGLNSILGYVESFNKTHFCRFCKIGAHDINNILDDRKLNMRDKTNYQQDVNKNDFQNTGIRSSCGFNKIKYFNVTDNKYVDVMHDILEGTARYDLALILREFIKKKLSPWKI